MKNLFLKAPAAFALLALYAGMAQSAYVSPPHGKGFSDPCVWMNQDTDPSNMKRDRKGKLILTEMRSGHCESNGADAQGLRWYKRAGKTCVETTGTTVVLDAGRYRRETYTVPKKVSACF